MGIKSLPLCALCGLSDDSVEHTLITCPISKELRRNVQDWIIELGIPVYTITDAKIATGELEKSICINNIILLTTKVTYNFMKED